MYDRETEFAILLGLVAELATDMRGAVYSLQWASAEHPSYGPRLRIAGSPLFQHCMDRSTVTLHIDGDVLVVEFSSPGLVGRARVGFTLDDPADVARAKTIVVRGFWLSSREWAVRVRAGWSLDRILDTPGINRIPFGINPLDVLALL